jgi:DNA repair exonuclease SbcCD ATPase subunit
MPPAPIDLLSDDVRRLEKSNQRIVAPADSLDAEVRDLREEFAGFRGRVDASLSFVKWLGVFFFSILVAVVVGAGQVVWDASAVNSKVKQQDRRLDEAITEFKSLTSEVKQQGRRLDEVDSQVKQQGQRLLEAIIDLKSLTSEVKQQGQRLDDAIAEVKSLTTEMKQQGRRLDGVEKQLDVLIHRTEPRKAE